jgi:outer membrane lipase/esterase
MLAAVSAAALLTACGGGGNSGETKATITSVKVVGASLADSGTFGYKFTVQSTSGTAYKVYPERIAATYGLSNLCSAYTSPDGGSTWATHSSCTNYAVAGAKVNYTSGSTSVDTVPVSAIKQLTDMGNAGFSSGDLLIVGEAGANDAAALVTAYLSTALYSTTDFTTLLSSLVSPSVISANASSPATLGVLYMQALADKLVAAIKTNALDKGAPRIAVLNTLDVTETPRFQAVLAQVSTAQGATAAQSLHNLVVAWIEAYNARLASDLAPYSSKVAVVDFYTNFNAEMNDPAQYGLTNVRATVCDQIYSAANSVTPSVATAGTTALSTPAVVGACTDSAASALTPTQNATGTTWWQTYLYADNFHPTPYGHQLLAQLVAKRLTEAGWL